MSTILFAYSVRTMVTYGMGHKKFPFFKTRYRATVILRSVFVSVLFYNFPCFYCCVSILKLRRKERLKNGKKNSAKNVTKKTVRKIITVQRTFKNGRGMNGNSTEIKRERNGIVRSVVRTVNGKGFFTPTVCCYDY